MASTGRHVGFESWLERDHLMLLDFDPDVTAVSSQPFWLHWQGEDGRGRRHVPDFFARLADGTGAVVDIRPDDLIPEKDVEVFAVTAAAWAAGGWEFRRLGDIDPVLATNARWLSSRSLTTVATPMAPRNPCLCKALKGVLPSTAESRT
jgi:hypothetical protein